ncbi:MAG TPA: hypothetical protein VG406_26260 [Isosphaeraceae bacterium]|jgi:hypothetical protein|nr:hypothetical protein [Isosphaeraceae bacterium]
MTTHGTGAPRRLKAAFLGLGLDGLDGHQRIITGEHSLVVGGSAETHADLLETVLRLESELDRLDKPLGAVSPAELAEIAWRIDSPELHAIALRLDAGLRRQGRSFHESTAAELTDLAANPVP